mmetsp:Transcript_42412/g.81017  ORF Transcript_42412/g.81017 Transcript_42412/m.81017 type:complete len:205 (+) Transcript_42412:435-1049(+)
MRANQHVSSLVVNCPSIVLHMVQAHGHPESAQVNHVVAEAEARRSCHHEVEVRRREEQAVPRLEPAQRGRRPCEELLQRDAPVLVQTESEPVLQRTHGPVLRAFPHVEPGGEPAVHVEARESATWREHQVRAEAHVVVGARLTVLPRVACAVVLAEQVCGFNYARDGVLARHLRPEGVQLRVHHVGRVHEGVVSEVRPQVQVSP